MNKQHTKIKHEILRRYLYICDKVHKEKAEWYYLETNAGNGLATYKDETREGSALLAAQKNAQCVFIEESPEKCKMLRRLLEKKKNIKAIICGDCNKKIEEALEHVPPWFHSVCFIDPYNARELSWATVQAIINHFYKYKKTGQIRRPEIIMNFPINAIWRAAWLYKKKEDKKCEALNNFFGEKEWQSLLDKKDLSQNDFLEYFRSKFKKYYKYSFAYLVKCMNTNTPQYYLVFFYNHKLADKVIKDFMKGIDEWVKTSYVQDYYKVEPLFGDKTKKEKTMEKTILEHLFKN